MNFFIWKNLFLFYFIFFISAKIYFEEKFHEGWENRWIKSHNKEKEGTQGDWKWTAGKYFNDQNEDKGIQTTPDARFYQISAEFPEFSNKGKDLVIQYSVKHEQKIDCGGGYLKILPKGIDQSDFHGETPYNIMFGPDICGSTKKTHLIFNYKGKNHLVKKEIRCETDEWTHLYTLVLHPDNTYEVYIDQKEVEKGNLKEDFDMLPPKEIKDPQAKKPDDWVDEKMIPDPEDKKPEGWDDIPAEIPDPDAKKPDDWDDELDGEWEPPMIPNPEYKGEWKPRMIENPAYKGEWVHPMIPNPDYYDDDNLYMYENNNFVGFELWQVKSGTIFDNIIITDNKEEADKLAELTKLTQEGEKKMYEKEEEERKKAEEEEKKKKEAEMKEDDNDEEEDNKEKTEKDEL
jgi:calreticulin